MAEYTQDCSSNWDNQEIVEKQLLESVNLQSCWLHNLKETESK